MFVSPEQSSAIAWGIGGGVATVATIFGLWLIRRGAGLRAIPLFVIALAGLLFGISRQGHGTLVVIASSDGQSQPDRIERRLYGTASYQYRNGRSEPMQSGGHVFVVNDTPVGMTLETVSYGLGPSTEQELPAFSSISIGGKLDFFGPNDQPPPKTTSQYGTWKYWLRW